VWRTVRAKELLSALKRIGWSEKRQTGSHRVLQRSGWADCVFPFHDGVEIGPAMVAKVSKKTGLKPGDL
jgi:predicted RNA binding protein YcfA (HicA-like mRNA interferase family)